MARYARAIKKISIFFGKMGGNEVKFVQVVDLWVGGNCDSECQYSLLFVLLSKCHSVMTQG